MIQIDIAQLLAINAGLLLAQAQKAQGEKSEGKEAEFCIQAILLFQSAIEAILNEELLNHPLLESVRRADQDLHKRYKSLSFKNKWKKVYDTLQIQETEYLDIYLQFYKMYRVPITHPKSRYVNVEKYTFQNVLEGFENGWYALQLVYAILGKELTSWEEFCRTAGILTV
ncbi:hypothetical protein KAZ66_00685 [Candidatus Woesebacteria bacterium]|nr:hypothetical protein [Candidatus Woesebacteria bacterium]